jgi:hypothetical protein
MLFTPPRPPPLSLEGVASVAWHTPAAEGIPTASSPDGLAHDGSFGSDRRAIGIMASFGASYSLEAFSVWSNSGWRGGGIPLLWLAPSGYCPRIGCEAGGRWELGSDAVEGSDSGVLGRRYLVEGVFALISCFMPRISKGNLRSRSLWLYDGVSSGVALPFGGIILKYVMPSEVSCWSGVSSTVSSVAGSRQHGAVGS